MGLAGNGPVNLGSAYGEIVIDVSRVERDINGQIARIEGGLGAAFSRIGGQLQGIGAQMTLALAPVTMFATRGLGAFMNFDAILTEIQARTGLTADEMDRVQAVAIEMGQKTAFSATDAANAMLQLVTSGSSVEEAISALPSVLDLAAAGSLDLGYSADALTDIMAQFGLEVENAGDVTDALTRAAGSSSATVNDLIQGFANVGPIASSFGLSVDETAAVLAVFAENGIKGAEAGTQLKSMLTNMTRDTNEVQGMWDELGVSMYDAQGNMRNLDDVIDDLNLAMDGMSDQERIRVIQTLAGSYGQMGLTALLAAGGLDEMQAKMEAAAAASVVAKAQLASFRGIVSMLRSSLETLSIVVLGPLAEQYLMPLTIAVTQLINELVAWLLVNPEIAATLGLIVGGLSVLGPALFMVGTFIQIAASGFMMLAPIITAVGIALGLILSPVGLVVTAIAGLYAAWQFNLFGIRDITADTWADIRALFEEGRGYIEGLGESIGEALNNIRLPEFNLPTLPSFDLGQIKADIEAAFAGLELTIDFSGLGDQVSQDLINALLAALSILVGGPIGIAIGVSRLVLLAFENDFMGFRTALEESGVITAVEDGLNTVLDTITGFFSGDMTGEGQAPALDFTWFSDAWNSIAGVLTKVGKFLAGKWTTNIQPGIIDLGDGILGFFTAFEDTDTEGFVLLAQRVGDALVLLFGALVVAIGPIIDIGTQLIGTALSSIGAILPVLGEAISDFVSVVSLLLQGDFAGAFSTFTTGLGEFFEGIVNWRIDQANAVLDFLSGLLGLDLGQIGELDLAKLSEGLQGAADFINNAIIQPIMTGLGAIDWGAVLGNMWTLFVAGLKAGLSAAAGWATFIYDNVIVPLAGQVQQYVASGQLWDDLQALGGALLDAIKMGISSYMAYATFIFDNIITPLAGQIQTYWTSGQLWDDLKQLGTFILDGIKMGISAYFGYTTFVWDNIISPLGQQVSTYWSSGQLWDNLKSLGTAWWEGIKQGITAYVGLLTFVWDNLLAPLMDQVAAYITEGGLWDTIKAMGAAWLDAIVAGLDLYGQFVNFVWEKLYTPLIGQISAGLQGIKDAAKVIGEGIINGIIDGVNGLLGSLQSTITGAANSAINWFKGPLGISSPSKVFKGFGGDIVDGLAMGLRDLNGLELAMSTVVGKTMPTPMPAEGLGGGRSMGNQTSNAWTINVSVPAEVLRNEPGLGRNADMFGDMLLQRMRGKGGR